MSRGDSLWKRLRRRFLREHHRQRAFDTLEAFHAGESSLERSVWGALELGTEGEYRVKSVQIASEITALARAVAAIEPQVVVEIGTHRAGTFFLWAQLAARRVISCDIVTPGPRAELYPRFAPPARGVEVIALHGDSHDPGFRAELEGALDGDPVDFLFIDGDHSEAGVEADYRDYRSLVRPGGLIAFHDIVERQPIATNQVHRFWRRLAAEHPESTETFVDSPAQVGFGIGLLRVE